MVTEVKKHYLKLEVDATFYFYLDGLDGRNQFNLINLQATIKRLAMMFMVLLVSYFHGALVMQSC